MKKWLQNTPFRPSTKLNSFQPGDESPWFLTEVFPRFCHFHHATMSDSEHLTSFCSSLQQWKPTRHNLFSHIFKAHIINEYAVLPLHVEQVEIFSINQHWGYSSRFHQSYNKTTTQNPNIPSLNSHSKVYMKCVFNNCPTASLNNCSIMPANAPSWD